MYRTREYLEAGLAEIQESPKSAGVIELIVRKRNDEHRPTGAQSLRGCADATLMDDGRGVRENLRIRQIVPGENRRRKIGWRGIFSEEKQGAPTERLGGR